MGKRNSFFGVTLPPTKEELIGSGAATITFRLISEPQNKKLPPMLAKSEL